MNACPCGECSASNLRSASATGVAALGSSAATNIRSMSD